jgi:hypothetical protein
LESWPAKDARSALAQLNEGVLWLTDRLGIVRRERYELGWGCWIVALAQYGVTTFILSREADHEKSSQLNALEEDFADFINEFRTEADMELATQFRKTIIERLD